MATQFTLPSSTSQSPNSTLAYSRTSPVYSSDEDDDLPFPAELPRSDFLAPDFNPSHYLSSLRNRHQTLEDLRSDLRQRSQLLSKELLDLVNANYESFLGLGADLRGGEEKVEGVRVGLLGFKREVASIQDTVRARQEEMAQLLKEKREARKTILLGRDLLEIENALTELEEDLGFKGSDDGLVDEDDDEDALNGDAVSAPSRRLQRQVRHLVLLTRAAQRVGVDHPFVRSLNGRFDEVRKTLLLDMATALRQAKSSSNKDDTLVLLKLYADLHAEAEGLRIGKGPD